MDDTLKLPDSPGPSESADVAPEMQPFFPWRPAVAACRVGYHHQSKIHSTLPCHLSQYTGRGLRMRPKYCPDGRPKKVLCGSVLSSGNSGGVDDLWDQGWSLVLSTQRTHWKPC